MPPPGPAGGPAGRWSGCRAASAWPAPAAPGAGSAAPGPGPCPAALQAGCAPGRFPRPRAAGRCAKQPPCRVPAWSRPGCRARRPGAGVTARSGRRAGRWRARPRRAGRTAPPGGRSCGRSRWPESGARPGFPPRRRGRRRARLPAHRGSCPRNRSHRTGPPAGATGSATIPPAACPRTGPSRRSAGGSGCLRTPGADRARCGWHRPWRAKLPRGRTRPAGSGCP
ncbi:hypothetical protein D9M72_509170 [compost metagenome]